MVPKLLRQKTIHTLCGNAKPKQFQNNSHKAVKSSQLPVKITTHLVVFHAASYLTQHFLTDGVCNKMSLE